MRKGIIVVDIPEYCCRCPFEVCGGDKYYCNIYETLNIAKKATPLTDRQIKPDWCPIRPIPVQPPLNMALTPILEDSWNASNKEIMGNETR